MVPLFLLANIFWFSFKATWSCLFELHYWTVHELYCLFCLSQPMNINKFCDIWNDKQTNDLLNFIQVCLNLLKKILQTTIYAQCLVKCQRGVFLIKNLTAGLAHCCRLCIIHRYRTAWQYLRNHLLQHYILYFKLWLKIF